MIIIFEILIILTIGIMSTTFEDFKKVKINNITSIYNQNIVSLTVSYNNIIKQYLNNKIFKNKVNVIILEYNNKINILKKYYDNEVNAIKKMVMPPIVSNKNKNALLIGINYLNTQNELRGCINDVDNMNNLLKKYNFQSTSIMTDNTVKKPTKDNILNEFQNMLINSKSGDIMFLFYSGHGSYTIDINSNEKTGYDQMILPIDLKPIVDDELKNIINKYLKKDVLLIALFDSCFSGSVLDLQYEWMDSLDFDKLTENTKENETNGNVIMISGCSDIQTSADTIINNVNQGAMTWSFLQSFNENITWRQLLITMRELLKKSGYSQIPQLASGSFFNIDSKVFI
jgi:hypothetical protein